MLVTVAMPTVNLSMGPFENFVLIATLVVLCAYWGFRGFGRHTFTRWVGGDAAKSRSAREAKSRLTQPQIGGQ